MAELGRDLRPWCAQRPDHQITKAQAQADTRPHPAARNAQNIGAGDGDDSGD